MSIAWQAARFLRFLLTTVMHVAPEHQCDARADSVIRGHFCTFSLSQFAEFSAIRSFSCTFAGSQVPLSSLKSSLLHCADLIGNLTYVLLTFDDQSFSR